MDEGKGENSHLQRCFREPGLEAGYSNNMRLGIVYILGGCVFLATYLAVAIC